MLLNCMCKVDYKNHLFKNCQFLTLLPVQLQIIKIILTRLAY